MRVEPLGYLKQVLPEEGQVAQLVELRIEDPGVGGSKPSLSTKEIRTMNRVFRTVQGESVDVVSHTLDVLKECPYVEIHIGTDSQNHRRSTVYVTVIAYRYGNRGVHYILHKQKMKKIRDKWTRLWNEADYSIEVAEWLTKNVKTQVEIDLDYNSQEKHFSSKLVPPVVGWAMSLGYKTNIKPDNQIATKAADHHCR